MGFKTRQLGTEVGLGFSGKWVTGEIGFCPLECGLIGAMSWSEIGLRKRLSGIIQARMTTFSDEGNVITYNERP